MTISKGDTPFLMISENRSGKVDGFAVLNHEVELLARGEVGDNGVSFFAVFGNPLNGQESTPVLLLKASETPGRWKDVTYAATTQLQGRDYYPMVGEVYEDLDFNGQFDAKRVYNGKTEIIAQAIYLDGAWKEILRVSDDGLFLKVGKYYPDDGTAFSTEAEQRTHYRFRPGVGWKVEKIDCASDGWETDPNDPIGKGQRLDDITRIKKEQKGMLTRFPQRR